MTTELLKVELLELATILRGICERQLAPATGTPEALEARHWYYQIACDGLSRVIAELRGFGGEDEDGTGGPECDAAPGEDSGRDTAGDAPWTIRVREEMPAVSSDELPMARCMGCGRVYSIHSGSPQPLGPDGNGEYYYEGCNFCLPDDKTKIASLEAEIARLRDRLAPLRFAEILCDSGVINRLALEDPKGYDRCATLVCVRKASERLLGN
jgi:hypothetical protein